MFFNIRRRCNTIFPAVLRYLIILERERVNENNFETREGNGSANDGASETASVIARTAALTRRSDADTRAVVLPTNQDTN